jgi:hypothetical protein
MKFIIFCKIGVRYNFFVTITQIHAKACHFMTERAVSFIPLPFPS